MRIYARLILAAMLISVFALLLHDCYPPDELVPETTDPAPRVETPIIEIAPATMEEHRILRVRAAMSETETEIEEDQELLLFANTVEAEAGNQDETGKRLVADVILNRVDDPDFEDTIEGVITHPYHFTSYWDGGMEKWQPTEKTIQICREELENRLNSKVLFFTAGEYNPYGTPAFKHGDHYFSYK